jgi:phosphatidate cytidylyltransferase
MLRWRLLLGTLLIAAMIGLCWLDCYAAIPGLYLMPLAVLAAILATQEVLSLAAEAQLKPLAWPIYVGNLLLVLGNWFVVFKEHRFGCPVVSDKDVAIPSLDFQLLTSPGVLLFLGLAVLFVVFREMFRYEKPGGNMANVATGVFALVYVGLMLSFAVQLRLNWGIVALAAWVIVVKMGDTGAYTVGRLIGRHKMAPHISPGKTMEGAAGALAFSCLGAWVACKFLAPLGASSNSVQTSPWWGWIVFGVVVGMSGLLGDLAESMLKRDVGRKDSSTWLPGFGGVLDILDSLLLSAPVAWACCYFGIVRF